MSVPDKPLDTLKTKTASGVFWTVVGLFGYRGCGFVIFIILARLLTPEEFGLVALSFTYIAFIQIFLDPGFAEAIVQRDKLTDIMVYSAFWINSSIGIFLSLLSFLCAPLIAILLNNDKIIPVVQSLSPIFIILGFVAVPTAILRRNFGFKQLALSSVVGVIVGGGVGVTVALLGGGVWALVLYQLVNKFIESVLIIVRCPWQPRFKFNFESVVGLFRFGINITGSRVVTYATRYGADLVIGMFLGTTSAGYFNVAFRLVRTIVELAGNIISKVYLTLFSRLQNDKNDGHAVMVELMQQIAFIFFPLLAMMGILSPIIIDVFFGSQWHPAAPVMQVLVLIGMLNIILYINDSILIANGKPHWKFRIDIINAVTNIIILLLTVNYGLVTIVSGYTIRAYLIAPVSILCVCRLYNGHFYQYIRVFFPFLTATLFMVLGLNLIKQTIIYNVQNPIVYSLLIVTFGGGIYYGIMHLVFHSSLQSIPLTPIKLIHIMYKRITS